jgi:hypothetical protein
MTAMNPSAEILGMFDEWEKLTESEWEAITRGAWERLANIQERKKTLQFRIDAASQGGGDFSSDSRGNIRFDPVIKARAAELIRLETRNKDALSVSHQAATEERAEIEKAARHLRQIKKSYVSVGGANWNQYG